MQQGFFRRYGLALILCAFLIIPPSWVATGHVLGTNSNNVRQWLPRGFTETIEFEEFVERFGRQEAVIVSWPGCTVDDPRLDRFAAAIVEPSGKFGQGPRYFRDVLTGRELYQEMISDPRNIPPQEALKRLDGVVVGSDLKTTCAVCMVSREGQANRTETLSYLYAVAREECALSSEVLRVGGPTVDIVAMDRGSEKLFHRYSGISAFVALMFALLCLRDIRLVLALFQTALLATGLGMIIFYVSGATMNALLMLLPALWFVLSVSGCIHFIHYYRDATVATGVEGAADRALAKGWLPCTLATLTTSIGLGSLMVCDILPVFNFGLYSAAGLIAGLILLFLFLPSLLALYMGRSSNEQDAARVKSGAAAEQRSALFWLQMTALLRQHYGKVSLVFVVVMLGLGAGLVKIYPSAKLKDYFPENSRIFRDYAWLEEHVSPLVPFEVAIHFKRSSPLSFIDRIKFIGEIEESIEEIEFEGSHRNARCYSAATMVPEIPPPKGVVNITRRRVLITLLENQRESFVASRYIIEEPEEEIWRVTVRVSATSNENYGRFDEKVQAQVQKVLDRRSDDRPHVDATYTGAMRLTTKVQEKLMDVLYKSFLLAFLLIGLAMIVALRSVGGGIVAMLPNVFPVMVTFGAMGWMGMTLDVGSIMTASVALGIAVDDTFHFLIWYSRGRREGQKQAGAVVNAYRHCGVAMIQTTLICGCGLLVFLLSDFNPAARFGGLMFTMLAAALVGDLFFLPALLLGPAGRLFGGKQRPKAAISGKPRA